MNEIQKKEGVSEIIIQNIRREKGVTQEALAQMVGVNRSAVAKWETGKALPRLETLVKIADALSCPVDELIGGMASRNNAQR